MSEELKYVAQEMYEPEKEARMNEYHPDPHILQPAEDKSLEVYEAAINEVNERFGAIVSKHGLYQCQIVILYKLN